MTHTVITFLGIRPMQTTYRYKEEKYQGQVFAEAMLQFLTFDRMLVLTTPEAENVFAILEEKKDSRIQKVPIPTGRDDGEMWSIFDRVIEYIQEGEEVTFDITHGLRSIPFLAFLFAAYLKSAKNVTLRAILYGALDLKDDGVAPVLDLSRFAAMLDWITAADQFIQTGNAIRLADLLKSREKNAAQSLEAVSRAALMTQPFSLSKEARNLQRVLRKAATSFAYTSQPFSVLAEKISQTFSHFILPEEISRDTPLPCEYGEKLLSQEWDLIEWYQEHGHWMQALTLAREFLIDLVTWEVGDAIDLKPENRNVVERGISGVFRIGRQFRDENGEERLYTESDLNRFGEKFYRKHPRAQEIATVFDTVSTLRNQLNHAEHKKDAIRFSKLIQKIPEELEKVRKLYEQRSLIPLTEQENAP